MATRIRFIIIISVITLLLTSCDDFFNDLFHKKKSSKVNYPVLEWGASQEIIQSEMSDFSLLDSDSLNMYYQGKGDESMISYYFVKNQLRASLVLIPKDKMSFDAIKSQFSSYNELGSISNEEVYVHEGKNTMVTIDSTSNNGTTYYCIGYAPLINNKQ